MVIVVAKGVWNAWVEGLLSSKFARDIVGGQRYQVFCALQNCAIDGRNFHSHVGRVVEGGLAHLKTECYPHWRFGMAQQRASNLQM